MAKASSYPKLTELTAEQQTKFKETATILAQGKTATDGATTDINIPFDEFGGSSGGGGGYTVSNLAPSDSDLIDYTGGSQHNKGYVINATNKSLIFLDLSSVADSNFEYVVVNLPSISATEYYDIVIQTTGIPSSDYKFNVLYTNQSHMQEVDNNFIDGANVECHIFGKHFVVSPMQRGGDES